MKRRILESEEKLLIDDEKDDDLEDIDSEFDSDEDFEETDDLEDIGSEKENDSLDNLEKDDLYSHYSDLYKEKHNIRPRWVHPSDVSAEELRRMIDDLYQDPGYSDDEDDYSDREDNKEYFDDLDAKSSEDSEIEDLAGLGPEDGEEFHTFAGMGKGRHGRNRIHEVTPQQTKYVSPVPKKPRSFWRMMFPGLADEIDLFTGNHTKEIKKHYQNQSAEADRERIKREREAQQNKEDEIRREKNYQDQKAARAASDEKYRGMNRDQRDQAYLDSKGKRIQTDYENGRFVKTVVPIKENRMSNKITVGQLRQIIKEELEQNIKTQELSNKIENWVEQHRAELEKFYASNPKAVKILQKIASKIASIKNQPINENDFINGVKDYFTKPWFAGRKDDDRLLLTALGALGMPLTDLMLMILPNNLLNTLNIGENEKSIIIFLPLLIGSLLDIANHADNYAHDMRTHREKKERRARDAAESEARARAEVKRRSAERKTEWERRRGALK